MPLFFILIGKLRQKAVQIGAILFLLSAIHSVSAQTELDAVFPQPPGYLTRPLEQAKTALANEDYTTAIIHLAELIGLDSAGKLEGQDDFFLPTKRKFALNSIRQQAWNLIGNMPARGRSIFELKYGIAARKKLEAAITADNLDELADVGRSYFHTKAGYVATFLMGKEKFRRGDYEFALRYFDKLYEVEAARTALDPGLSIHRAIGLGVLQNKEDAVATLMTLKDADPNLKFIWDGEIQNHTLVDDESTLTFLDELISDRFADSKPVSKLEENEWLSFRSKGNQSLGQNDQILPIPDWSIELEIGKRKEVIEQMARTRMENGSPGIPVTHAIGLKDSILFRTQGELFAVDVDSGKRTWKYPWSHQPVNQQQADGLPLLAKQIGPTIWSASIDGRMTSDGHRVFFVQTDDQISDEDWDSSRLLRRQNFTNPTNSLVALKIVDEQGTAVEGQLAWKIDTSRKGSEFTNGVFLGPPLLKDDIAYVLYEIRGTVRVAGLNSATGDILWSQQIASTQSHEGYDQKIFRYGKAATPVFASGLLICPTMVGGLVAIDLTDRSLKWGFKYKTYNETRFIQGLDQSPQTSTWSNDALFVLDGSICFSPVESRSYFVIRLETGKTRIERPKKNNNQIAGKYQDRMVLVGTDELTLDPISGFAQTKIDFSAFGTPVGTGFFADRFYFLPLSGQQLLKINLEEKKVEQVIKTETRLGNLSCYAGRIISQSTTSLDCFWLREAAQSKRLLNQTVQKRDASSWLVQAQIHETANETDLAIDSVIRSIQITPAQQSSAYLSSLMVKRIGQPLQIDWKRMEAGASLLNNARDRRSYLLAKIESLFSRNESDKAIPDLLALIELYASESKLQPEMVTVSPTYKIAGWRLVRTRLRRAWQGLSDDRKNELVDALGKRYQKSVEQDGVRELRRLAEVLGEFDFTNQSINVLAQKVLTSNRREDWIWAKAKLIEALETFEQPSETKGREKDANLQIDILVGLAELTSRLYSSDDSYSVDIKRRTLVELTERLSSLNTKEFEAKKLEAIKAIQLQLDLNGEITQPLIPDGMTRIDLFQEEEADNLFIDAQDRRHASRLIRSRRIAPLEFRLEFDERGFFLIRDRFGALVFQGDSRTRGSRHANNRFEHSQFQLLGDLLVISCGYNHIALDVSNIASLDPGMHTKSLESDFFGENEIYADVAALWRHNTFQPVTEISRARLRREANSLELVTNELEDSRGHRIAKTSFLSSNGFCILSGGSLVCLDPWTGDVSWQRDGFKPGDDLTGDDKHVFVLSADGRKVTVYQTLDGTKLVEHEVPANMINRMLQRGTSVVSLGQDDQAMFITGFNLETTGIKQSWTHKFPRNTRADSVDANTLATLSPTGLFQLVDITTGEVIREHPLTLDFVPKHIKAQMWGDQLLLLVNNHSVAQVESLRSEPGGTPQPTYNLDGLVFLFDEKGPLWPAPARIDQYDLVLNQPAISPALMFKKRFKNPNATELLFIRRSDGSPISFSQPIKHTGATTNVRFLPSKQLLAFNIGYYWLALKFSSFPRPPEPAAQTGKYSGTTDREKKHENDSTENKKDPFIDGNDPFSSKGSVIRHWILEEWKRSPMNNNRSTAKDND